MQAQYVGIDTGRTLGQCSNLSAVTWGQGAAIGGHPYRSALHQLINNNDDNDNNNNNNYNT